MYNLFNVPSFICSLLQYTYTYSVEVDGPELSMTDLSSTLIIRFPIFGLKFLKRKEMLILYKLAWKSAAGTTDFTLKL